MVRCLGCRVALAAAMWCLGVISLGGADANAATVNPDVIFGSGVANGSFTAERRNGIELGLRARLYFDENNLPQNVFNWDAASTYSFATGVPGGVGYGTRPNSTRTASWNFEWSINSDVDGVLGRKVGDLTYRLLIDTDPTAGTNFFGYDPINGVRIGRYAFGDNATGNGGGTVATDAAQYSSLIFSSTVAQHSQNLEWLGSSVPFVNSVPGLYDFRLLAFAPNDPAPFALSATGEDPGQQEPQRLLASTAISVSVGGERPVAPVPVPASLPLLAAALGLTGLLRARWRR